MDDYVETRPMLRARPLIIAIFSLALISLLGGTALTARFRPDAAHQNAAWPGSDQDGRPGQPAHQDAGHGSHVSAPDQYTVQCAHQDALPDPDEPGPPRPPRGRLCPSPPTHRSVAHWPRRSPPLPVQCLLAVGSQPLVDRADRQPADHHGDGGRDSDWTDWPERQPADDGAAC